jgi:hypothetical protein
MRGEPLKNQTYKPDSLFITMFLESLPKASNMPNIMPIMIATRVSSRVMPAPLRNAGKDLIKRFMFYSTPSINGDAALRATRRAATPEN